MKKRILVFMAIMAFILPVGKGLAQEKGISLEGKNTISLDIKGMDIVDVLKMLSTRTGMNIVVGKNVTGRVTLFLKNVDIWDAFEIILLANDLAYEKKGDIINVMTQRDYELQYGERYQDKKQAKTIQLKYAKAVDLARALTQIKSNVGKIVVDEGSNTLVLLDNPQNIKEMENFIKKADLPLKTRVFSLNYAQADKLQPKIQEAITKGVGSIKIDERTNKIIVTDYPERLNEIAKIIQAFDEKTPQVLIDAQIIEIRPSDKFEMGVDWDYWIEKNFKVAGALPIGTGSRLLLGTANITPTGPGQYKAVLDLLRTIGDTKILSSPRIMVLNNQEAKILVGTKDAYITSATSQAGDSSVTSQTVNFVDVGIKLFVTPTINRDGFVIMKIKPEISSATRTDITSEGQITQIPIVSTSETETTVMVKDGVTIIIGGLRKDARTKTVKKIPLLGDIPGLGFLFRSTSDELTKTELIILLTPHIMSGEDAFTDMSDIRPKDGAMAKMEKGDIVTQRIHVALDKNKNRVEDPSSEFYKLVAQKVKNSASFDGIAIDEKGEVEVIFTLGADGELKDEPKVLNSTNQNLNTLAVETIKSITDFPAFPRGFNKEEEKFYIVLEYK